MADRDIQSLLYALIMPNNADCDCFYEKLKQIEIASFIFLGHLRLCSRMVEDRKEQSPNHPTPFVLSPKERQKKKS